MKLPLSQLNGMTQERFTGYLEDIFEDSSWVAEYAWLDGPFANLDELHGAMCGAVIDSGIHPKLALLLAHPDLGARVQMADASVREQKGASLDALPEDQHKMLLKLNNLYRQKFGFPFIFAVKGKTLEDIISSLEERILHDREEEFRTALNQVFLIAKFRLQEKITEGE